MIPPPVPLSASAGDGQAAAPPAESATRALYWSVRRELWESRGVYMAPLIVAAVALLGFLVRAATLPRRMQAMMALDPAKQRQAVALPYSMIAALLMLIAFIVGVFYCLDALHGERRDRSILFWKSLPVSDLTTVLAKASIPLVVLPLLVFVLIVITQLILLLSSTVVLLLSGVGAAIQWTQLPVLHMEVALLYALVAIALWHAPIYAWLLMVSGWTRRATFLWAVLPPLAICAFERIAFRTSHFASFLRYRLLGWFNEGFDFKPSGRIATDPLTQLTPGHFVATPGLWLGLVAAAIFLGAAVRLRRNREPI